VAAGFTPQVSAGDGDGGYAGAFFQVPIGARPTAMGGAYRSLSDDGAGPLFNPAGAALVKKPIFGSSYRTMKFGRRLGYASVLVPTANRSTLGLNWLYSGSGGVERRNYDGDALGDELTMHQNAFGLVFAVRFEEFLSLGVKGNYLTARFAEMDVYSVGIDVGAMLFIDQLLSPRRDLPWPVQDVRVGVTVKYIDAKFNWNNEKYILRYVDGESGVGTEQEDVVPMEFGLGISGRLMQKKLVVAADISKNDKQGVEFHLGSEYFFKPEVVVRAGYGKGRLAFGGGYLFTVGSMGLALDYAFSLERAGEGSEHIFSFDLLF